MRRVANSRALGDYGCGADLGRLGWSAADEKHRGRGVERARGEVSEPAVAGGDREWAFRSPRTWGEASEPRVVAFGAGRRFGARRGEVDDRSAREMDVIRLVMARVKCRHHQEGKEPGAKTRSTGDPSGSRWCLGEAHADDRPAGLYRPPTIVSRVRPYRVRPRAAPGSAFRRTRAARRESPMGLTRVQAGLRARCRMARMIMRLRAPPSRP
jgi:hypothetical protein